MTNTMEINEEMLETVNGGTFTANMFEEEEYNRYGIRTQYHTWARDEFWLPDGTKTNEEGANKYMQLVDPEFYKKTKDAINRGKHWTRTITGQIH